MSIKNTPQKKAKKSSQKWGLENLQFPPPGILDPVNVQLADSPSKISKGLFQELLQGNPSTLRQFLTSETPEIAALLNALQGGTCSLDDLSQTERLLLDEATAEAVTTPKQKRKVNRPFEHVNKKMEEKKAEGTAPAGENALPAFWWV